MSAWRVAASHAPCDKSSLGPTCARRRSAGWSAQSRRAHLTSLIRALGGITLSAAAAAAGDHDDDDKNNGRQARQLKLIRDSSDSANWLPARPADAGHRSTEHSPASSDFTLRHNDNSNKEQRRQSTL